MERVHKANLLVILACVLTMSATTVMSYGMSTRTIKGCGVLWATLIIVMIVQFLQVSDFVKAMAIVLCRINLFRHGEWQQYCISGKFHHIMYGSPVF